MQSQAACRSKGCTLVSQKSSYAKQEEEETRNRTLLVILSFSLHLPLNTFLTHDPSSRRFNFVFHRIHNHFRLRCSRREA